MGSSFSLKCCEHGKDVNDISGNRLTPQEHEDPEPGDERAAGAGLAVPDDGGARRLSRAGHRLQPRPRRGGAEHAGPRRVPRLVPAGARLRALLLPHPHTGRHVTDV